MLSNTPRKYSSYQSQACPPTVTVARSANNPFAEQSDSNRNDDGRTAPHGAVLPAVWVIETLPPRAPPLLDGVLARMGSAAFPGATNMRTAATLWPPSA